MNRRSFLKLFGIGSASAVVAPELLVPEPEPVRRYWQVPRNAPVSSRKPWLPFGESHPPYRGDDLFGVEPGTYPEWQASAFGKPIGLQEWPAKYEHIYRHALVVNKSDAAIRPASAANLKPIGVVEAFNPETGIATVRLTVDSLPVWRGTGIA